MSNIKFMVGVDHFYEIEENSPAMAIVEVVADAENIDKTQLNPLQEEIDPDALNQLVAKDDAHVKFEYEGYEVVIGDGEILLTE
mgnify:CR=1 FL=1